MIKPITWAPLSPLRFVNSHDWDEDLELNQNEKSLLTNPDVSRIMR